MRLGYSMRRHRLHHPRLRASMRPRRMRLGYEVSAMCALGPLLRFNEAEAHAPRILFLSFHFSLVASELQ